jgi:hypothetical protein
MLRRRLVSDSQNYTEQYLGVIFGEKMMNIKLFSVKKLINFL